MEPNRPPKVENATGLSPRQEHASDPDAWRVRVAEFEGPLDLLLYLIRRQNIDILDIPIAEITKQYVQYIELMKEMGTFYVPTILAGRFVGEKAEIDGYLPEVVRPKAAAVGPQAALKMPSAWPRSRAIHMQHTVRAQRSAISSSPNRWKPIAAILFIPLSIRPPAIPGVPSPYGKFVPQNLPKNRIDRGSVWSYGSMPHCRAKHNATNAPRPAQLISP